LFFWHLRPQRKARRTPRTALSRGVASDTQIQEPRLKTRVPPSTPPEFKKAGLYGTVIVGGTIDIDGNVGDIHPVTCGVSKDHKTFEAREKDTYCPALEVAAADAYSRFRYEPILRDGKAVCVLYAVRFDQAAVTAWPTRAESEAAGPLRVPATLRAAHGKPQAWQIVHFTG
jgi:hypothetical protein